MSAIDTKKVACPACGSVNIETAPKQGQTRAPYATPVSYETVANHCLDCGEEGDFANQNEAAIQLARKDVRNGSIEPIIEYLSQHGVSMAYFERALDLPPHTVARWKNEKKCSAPSIALMRLIRTFPWLLEVAASDYAAYVADSLVVHKAGELLLKQIHQPHVTYAVTNRSSPGVAELHIALTKLDSGTQPAALAGKPVFRQLSSMTSGR